MKKQIVFIIISFFFIGCQNNGNGKLENEIAISIKKNCKNENCEIDISKITSFKWHKLYVFKETATLEVIEKAIQQEYNYFTDVARRLIFIDSNDKIIYHEDIFPNVEGIMNNEVVFSMSDTVHYRVFTSPNFIVSKEKINKGVYFILYQ
jgi:hypothetical protein